MSSRGQKSRLKPNKLELQADSDRRNSLRPSKNLKMSIKPSQPDKGSFDELKEILKRQNEYMEA